MFQYRDQLSLSLASGSGGDGCLSFYRSRKKPRGGPDGGDGGSGGSLILKSSANCYGFEHLKKKGVYRAESGYPGSSQMKKGRQGRDLTLKLPLGTVIRDEKGGILHDFAIEDKKVFLEGGRGGRGNSFFKTSLNQAPRQIQKGERGQTRKVLLELKPLIQVAVIGKTNTGKSSFFNLVSNKKSKIASYPYTTFSPNIGQSDSGLFFIMDIPGLAKGASKSVYKGLSFLRSIQRAKLLLHFIDSHGDQPLEDKEELEEELKSFDVKHSGDPFKGLSRKSMFFILSKTDQVENKSLLNGLIKKIKLKKNQRIFSLSNKTKQGLKTIVSEIENNFKDL